MNNRASRGDAILGSNLLGVFGPKDKCSDSGCRAFPDSPLASELEAISQKCEASLDWIRRDEFKERLQTGYTVIDMESFKRPVSVWRESGEERPDNLCIGMEYTLTTAIAGNYRIVSVCKKALNALAKPDFGKLLARGVKVVTTIPLKQSLGGQKLAPNEISRECVSQEYVVAIHMFFSRPPGRPPCGWRPH